MKKLPVFLIILFIAVHVLSLYIKSDNWWDSQLSDSLSNADHLVLAVIVVQMLRQLNRKNVFFKVIFFAIIIAQVGFFILNIMYGKTDPTFRMIAIILGLIWLVWLVALLWTNFRLYAVSYFLFIVILIVLFAFKSTFKDIMMVVNERTRDLIMDIPLLVLMYTFIRKPVGIDERTDPGILHE